MPSAPIRCLIADDMHPSLMPMLEQAGVQADYHPALSRDELLACIHLYEGLILRSKTICDAALLHRAVRLRFIGRAGAGLDLIDLEVVKQRGIHLLNAPEGNRDAVGEHTIGMLLCLMHRIHAADAQIRRLQWEREANRGYELQGKTVGIIGYGNMGRAFAKRLSGFDCRVLAHDRKPLPPDPYAEISDMQTIFEQAEVLSLHIPLDEQNRRLVTDEYLARFRHPLWFVNTARGEIAYMAPIIRAIQSGRILGAALDVLENEKLHTLSPEQAEQLAWLRASDRVLFTPHIAGWTHESYRKINEVLVHKIQTLLPILRPEIA